jgi:competence protein ComEA
MTTPDPLKSYRLYAAMFLLNLAVVIGVIYLLRREEPRRIAVTPPPTRPATNAAKKAAAQITVNVSGAVNQSGTIHLDSGARLADALQKAGVKPEADLSKLNLTLPLEDGAKIIVPPRAPGAPAVNNLTTSTLTPDTEKSPDALTSAKINLNTATLEQLDGLPGIGPVLAQRILDYRAQHGSFKTIEQVKEVKGIGDALFDEIKERITVQ